MFSKMTKETFSEQLNDDFQVELDAQQTISITLIEVTALPCRVPQRTWGRVSELPIRRDPFALVFRGPRDDVLPTSRSYLISHPQVGPIGPVLLTPIDQDSRGTYYETIFN